MKKCTKCGEEKALSEFNRHKRGKDGHHSWCRECMKSANRDHYQKNRERYLEKSAKRHREHMQALEFWRKYRGFE